jgi:hypothetical protein
MKESHRVEFNHLKDFKLRFDLYDTMVSVCNPDMLKHYEENFDFHVEYHQKERRPVPQGSSL